MRAMLPIRFCRLFTGCAVAAATTAASAQGFYHAPPTSTQDAPLLPIIRPAFRVSTPPTAADAVGNAPHSDEPVASQEEPLPRVPAHLSLNPWKRLPTAPSSPSAAVTSPEHSTVAQNLFDAPPEPPAPVVPTPDADHLRSLASRSLARGDVAAAESQLSAALERHPSDLHLAISLARVRETRGDWTGAVEAFDTVIRLDPAEARWKTRRAECRYFSGDYVNAVADYAGAEAASAPLSVSEYIRFGDAALRTGQFEVAETAYGTVSRLTKEPQPQVELLRGIIALKRGDADQARTILLRANAIWPNDAQLTEALRVASAVRHETQRQIARVHANEGLRDSVATAQSLESPEEQHAPVVSGWRPTRAKAVGNVQPASGELDETPTEELIAPAVEEEDGWRPASNATSRPGILEPDDGAVLSAPGEIDGAGQLP